MVLNSSDQDAGYLNVMAPGARIMKLPKLFRSEKKKRDWCPMFCLRANDDLDKLRIVPWLCDVRAEIQ